MFSGTVFTRAAEPPKDIRLPRSCWAFYQQVDGASTVRSIAFDLDLSKAETFAAIRLLQSYELVKEQSLTYAEFRRLMEAPDVTVDKTSTADKAVPTAEDDVSPDTANGTASGDGVMPSSKGNPADKTDASTPETRSYVTQSVDAPSFVSGSASRNTQTQSVPALHLPSFWEWLESKSANVKKYKNNQAFILMEALTALAAIGVESMDELEAMEQCDDPSVMAALEAAVENTINETIPESCYK